MCLKENITKLTKDQFTHNKTRTNICYTNEMRKKINAEIMAEVVAENKKVLKGKVVKLKAFAYDENSQDVSLLKGMPIIARMNGMNLGIANNNTYTIKSVADDIIVIKDDLERTMEIDTTQFCRLFNVAYCITTHCAQGLTYDHPYTIYEFNRFDLRLKYVALSRSKKYEYINII